MNTRMARLMTAAIMFAAVLGFGLPAFAQQYTGRIEVTVFDATGAVLPGVSVDVTGPLNQTVVTDARGEARFLNLSVGTYHVRATLQGFNEYRNTNVPVAAGVAVPLQIKLAVAGAAETIFVTAQSPVIDTKKQGTGVNVTLDELNNVPSARDPWVIMQTVPGIIMDRVNVGGSESGQQAGFMGKGADSTQATWNVDGMPITDMSSLSSPFYYDFDMFQEYSVTTGGADAKSATNGIQLNFMLKSGTNAFHGSAVGMFENEGMQRTNVPQDLKFLTGATGKGDRTEQIWDYHGEVGGPILKDHWWFWGAYGRNDIRIWKLSDVHDRSVLPNVSLKTQAQFSQALRGSFTFFQANKQKWGRDASVTRPQETTTNQTGPNSFYKGEVNYVVGNNLFLVGRYAHLKGGFELDPQGGMDTLAWRDSASVWHGSYNQYITSRPQDAVSADGNYFRGAHELKFGFTWRKTDVHSTSEWPQDYMTLNFPGDYPLMTTNIAAIQPSDGQSRYQNFYVGDTITLSRATISLGLRYDRATASVLPSTSPATIAPGSAAILPQVTAPGVSNALVFNVVEPRVGLTYALDEARKTQLRATYAMFTSQIGSGAASFLSVAQYRWFYVDAIDTNGDHAAQANEIDWSSYAKHIAAGDYGGYDPSDPTASVGETFHQVGSYGVPKTHEFIIGVDRELMPSFGVSASFTYRKNVDFNWRPTTGINAANYVQVSSVSGTLPTTVPGTTGGSYNVPLYGLADASLIPPGKGTTYQSRKGYNQTYKGFEISATKRLSNHWMARLGFSTNSWREHFSDPITSIQNPTHVLGSPNIDGGYVVVASGGSGKSGIYMVQPSYQFIVNGAYQAPYGIDLGVSWLLRQGYPMPWYQTTYRVNDPLGSTKQTLLVPDFGQDRLPGASTIDFRIGKTFNLQRATLNIDFDVFNLLNSATVLGRRYDASVTTGTYPYTQVMEIMQPTIGRIGLRLTF